MKDVFKILKKDGDAKLAKISTAHGSFYTPCFMNVATCGAIKGAVSFYDLNSLKCQVGLCNTYHLSLNPGEDVIYKFGGIHKFLGYKNPILTDSGGFQVFSLSKIRTITDDGVLSATPTCARPPPTTLAVAGMRPAGSTLTRGSFA